LRQTLKPLHKLLELVLPRRAADAAVEAVVDEVAAAASRRLLRLLRPPQGKDHPRSKRRKWGKASLQTRRLLR
jgi:hypothetical protein